MSNHVKSRETSYIRGSNIEGLGLGILEINKLGWDNYVSE